MINGAESEIKGFQVLIFHHDAYNRMFIPGTDKDEAAMAGVLAAQDVLGLMDGEYSVAVTPATRYTMAEQPKRKPRRGIAYEQSRDATGLE